MQKQGEKKSPFKYFLKTSSTVGFYLKKLDSNMKHTTSAQKLSSFEGLSSIAIY